MYDVGVPTPVAAEHAIETVDPHQVHNSRSRILGLGLPLNKETEEVM
jgi:hypothetical protein